jgi:SAM-dependent methyltransferase
MNVADYESQVRSSEVESEDVGVIRDLFTCRDSVDAWQHERMLRFLSPIINTYPDADWLTVGDAGADGWILRNHGVKAVTASSISDARLKKARELGYLNGIQVRALNAEQLELSTASFDLLLCSQTYHHLRRAPLGFYEFMRVSRIGFVLIEPAECSNRPLDAVRTVAKILLRRRRPIYDSFEPAGNYIYRVAERDVFRMLAAVGIRWYAIKVFNNFNSYWLASQRRDALLAKLIFKLVVGVQDVMSLCRLMSPGMCVVFVPTGQLAESAQALLRAARFRVVSIPVNPYVASRRW